MRPRPPVRFRETAVTHAGRRRASGVPVSSGHDRSVGARTSARRRPASETRRAGSRPWGPAVRSRRSAWRLPLSVVVTTGSGTGSGPGSYPARTAGSRRRHGRFDGAQLAERPAPHTRTPPTGRRTGRSPVGPSRCRPGSAHRAGRRAARPRPAPRLRRSTAVGRAGVAGGSRRAVPPLQMAARLGRSRSAPRTARRRHRVPAYSFGGSADARAVGPGADPRPGG